MIHRSTSRRSVQGSDSRTRTTSRNSTTSSRRSPRSYFDTNDCIPCHYIFRDRDVLGYGLSVNSESTLYLQVNLRCPRCHDGRGFTSCNDG